MSSTFLKGLLPEEVEFDGVEYVLLKDREIRDSIFIAAADRQAEAFVTRGTKSRAQANFFGDQSIVREKNLFMVLQVQIKPRRRAFLEDEWHDFYERGYYEMAVNLSEKVIVEEDILANVSGGPRPERVTNDPTVDESYGYGALPENRRTFLVSENKFIPGGRSIQFVMTWPEGVNGLLVTTEMAVGLYGGEYERRMNP